MEVVTRVQDGPYAGGVFLSFGDHDHDIALFPSADTSSRGREFEHVGLELDCFGDVDQLRRMRDFFLAKGVKVNEVLDHGVSIGVYFYDPDGHMLEVFAPLIQQDNRVSLAELRRNHGQANPIELAPRTE
jgi:catechol 2,3-dioxygenase-like lactoylglutathione lyase family enzyme